MNQSMLDQIFQPIYYQVQRLAILDQCKLSSKSVWNKAYDEKQILDLLIHRYREYYISHLDQLDQCIRNASQVQKAKQWFPDDMHIQSNETILLAHLVRLRQGVQMLNHSNVLYLNLCDSVDVPDIFHPYNGYLLKPQLLQVGELYR